MKPKFLILIFSLLLLIPVESGEIINAQSFEYFTSEVEEEANLEFTTPVFDSISIEDGGSFGNSAVIEASYKTEYIEAPVKLCIGAITQYLNSNKVPHYITYCRLKIAC